MKFLPRLSLSQRFVFLISTLMITSTVLLIGYAEKAIESVMLEETKKQALVFLQDLEKEFQLQKVPDKVALQYLVDHAREQLHNTFNFSIYQIYALAPDGTYLAHSNPDANTSSRKMSGYLGNVLRTKQPYLSSEIEHKIPVGNDKKIPVIDVVIALHHQADLIGILEVEIDVEKTLSAIQVLNTRLEREIALVTGTVFLVILVFLLWVVQRGLIQPINQLADVTRRIAGGELTARSGVRGDDELGQLGLSVNFLAGSIEQLLNEQEATYVQSLQALARALEAKDAYTASHSERVSQYSVMLARHIGLPEDEVRSIKQGAIMHDLGKIAIPDAILNKAGALTEHEYEVVKQHPHATYTIMRPLTRFKDFADIARWHHEHWDGNGYPDGLKGENIPLHARIVAIADTWDAMTGDRVYRKAMSIEKSLSILERELESGQWDPSLLRNFINMIRKQTEAREQMIEDIYDK